ncbi:MAG: CHAT domain-containing tetratricopeptide repeat protein [Cyanobacteria bacterium P01_F01_bin.153]
MGVAMRILGGAIALGILAGLPISGTSQAIASDLRVEAEKYDVEFAQADPEEQKAAAERLFNRGYQALQSSQFQDALQSWQAALELYRTLGDRQGEAGSLGNLGNAHFVLGQYDRAIDFHNQAFTITRETGDLVGQANALGNIGSAYSSLGQYDRAIDFYNQSLAIRRRTDDRQGEAHTLGNLGSTYFSIGQYERAIDLHNQVLTIARETGDRRGEASALGNLGNAYSSLGQYERAIDLHNQSLTIKGQTGDPQGEAISLVNLGNVYSSLNEHEHAIDLHNQALVITREIGSPRVEAGALDNLGTAYFFLGQYERAIDFHQQALAIARKIGDRRRVFHILNSLGLAHSSLENYAQAESSFRQSLTVAEAMEEELGANDRDRISFFETRAATYASLSGLLITQDNPGSALEIADRSRARSLVQFLNPATSEAPRDPINIDQIKQLARDKNATLITYSIVGQDLYVWVVSPAGELSFVKANPEVAGLPLRTASSSIRRTAALGPLNDRLFDQTQYRIDLYAMRGDGAEPPWAGSPEYLEQGYNLLIKPIEDYLPEQTGSRLIIVPHRELGTVPFTALFKEGQGFLIDRYTITVTPSLQTLDTLQRTTGTTTGTPLVVGNPSPMPDQLSPLPSSEAEATAIAQKLNTTPILGNQATEAHLKSQLSNASIIHFATHGIIQKSDRDLNSWLALANISNNSGEDNKLTLTEIFNSQLNAQLAVLSACNTNSGEISGEGVVGLARAFLKAGVPTVVASSWKVPDYETQILMEAFYDQLLAGKTYAEALRAAQLTVRANSPNPFTWAAFTLIGEGDRTLELP